MKYDLYDFDGTIYDGDSGVDIILFAMKKKPLIFFKLLIIITFIVLSSILVYSINKLGLVPNKYLYIGIAGLVILNLIAALLLLSKKLIPKIFSILIYILLLFAIVSGFYVCNTTNNF